MDRSKEWTLLAAPGLKLRWKLNTLVEIAIVSLALLLFMSIPYLFGYLTAPKDKWFSGIIYNVHDTAQYLTWMRESGSRYFFENKLTSEPTEPVFSNLHWWIPGRTAAVLNLSLAQIYQVFRLLTIPFYVGVTYWLSGLFFNEARRRRYTFWLTTLTSGFGWVWVIDKYLNDRPNVLWPHDVYTTPGNTFWVMLASPHLTMALAVTLLTLGLAWLGYEKRDYRLTLAAGVSTLFLGLGHIYDVVTVWAVLGVFGLLLTLRDGFRWETFWRLVPVVLISLPAPLYFGWVSSSAHPSWQQALAQYDNLGAFTPTPWHLLIFLGLTFFLAIGGFGQGLNRGLKAQSNRDLFLKGWFVVNLIIIYLPLKFQVMLLTGFQFVLAVLAIDFLFDRLIPWLAAHLEGRVSAVRLAQWLPLLVLVAVLPTNLYLFGWRLLDLKRANYPFYLTQGDVTAMAWLDTNASDDEVILSAFETGHYLPGLTGSRAFFASAVMTINFHEKKTRVQQFFAANTLEANRCALLTDYNITYLLYGPDEQALGDYDPATSALFKLAFASQGTNVYRLQIEACR